MAEPKYIRFAERGVLHSGRPAYDILNKRSLGLLGHIYWYPSWRQWVCDFAAGAIWSQDCLADVRAFMVKLADGQKESNG